MRLLKNTKVKDNQSGVTIMALTITIIMLGLLAGITLSIVSSDESLVEKTNHDTAEYNKQVENYREEYKNLTERVDGKENILDTLPEDF